MGGTLTIRHGWLQLLVLPSGVERGLWPAGPGTLLGLEGARVALVGDRVRGEACERLSRVTGRCLRTA
jgi:hypothetical protein